MWVEEPFSLTVVVPTHGGRRSLANTVNAVLAQRGCELEVIVVSDGEIEPVRAVLAAVDDERLRIIAQRNSGPAGARNLGLSQAKSSWVAFVDDDDIPREDWGEVWASNARDGDAVVTACVKHWVGDDVLEEERCCALDSRDATMAASRLLAGAFVARREALIAIGGYDPSLRVSENQDLGLRLLGFLHENGLSGGIRNVHRVVLDVFTERPDSRKRRYGESRAKAAKTLQHRYPERLAVDPEYAASLHRIVALSALERGDSREFRSSAVAAVRSQPTRWSNWRFLLAASSPTLARSLLARG